MTNQTSLRRGAICEIKDNEHHERNSIRFLVMKVIDENTVLVQCYWIVSMKGDHNAKKKESNS